METDALGKPLKLRIQVRSFDAMCQMVAAGLGVAVLPDAAIQPHLRSMGLRKIDLKDAWVHRGLLIGARDLKALPRPARLLVDHLSRAHAPRMPFASLARHRLFVDRESSVAEKSIPPARSSSRQCVPGRSGRCACL